MVTLFIFYMVLAGIAAFAFARLEMALRVPGFGHRPADKR